LEQPGEKKDDYWEPGKGLMAEPQKFLDSLFKFDKDNIPDVVIKSIQPYIDNEAFQPAAIAKVLVLCFFDFLFYCIVFVPFDSRSYKKSPTSLHNIAWRLLFRIAAISYIKRKDF